MEQCLHRHWCSGPADRCLLPAEVPQGAQGTNVQEEGRWGHTEDGLVRVWKVRAGKIAQRHKCLPGKRKAPSMIPGTRKINK